MFWHCCTILRLLGWIVSIIFAPASQLQAETQRSSLLRLTVPQGKKRTETRCAQKPTCSTNNIRRRSSSRAGPVPTKSEPLQPTNRKDSGVVRCSVVVADLAAVHSGLDLWRRHAAIHDLAVRDPVVCRLHARHHLHTNCKSLLTWRGVEDGVSVASTGDHVR